MTEQILPSSVCGDSNGYAATAHSPASKQMYLACCVDESNKGQGSISVFNAKTITYNSTTTCFGGTETSSIAYNPSNHVLYVIRRVNTNDNLPPVVAVFYPANQLNATITVIQPSSIAVS